MDKESWNRIKLFVAERHDFFEREYRKTNLRTDEAQSQSFGSVFDMLENIEQQRLFAQGKRAAEEKEALASGGNPPRAARKRSR